MSVFSVENLSVQFGTTQVASGVSFAVQAGQTLAIVGESGSGKSASLLGATGLLPPTAQVQGTVLHRGQSLLGLSPAALRAKRGAEIGFIFQDPQSNLHPLKPVGAQIAEAMTAHSRIGRAALRDRVVELLRDVGIHNPELRLNDYPHQFSGGMRQRVMIAIAVALNPALIIADEPTTALDVTVQASILKLLKRLQQDHGTALIFVSHDLAVVSDIADDVLVMQAGRVVEYGTADQIYSRPVQPYTRALLGAARLGGLAGRQPHKDHQAEPDLLVVENLSRSFAGRNGDGSLKDAVLQDVSFTLRETEILGLVGESGSGKSTIGRILAGLDRPDAGRVSLRGQTYSGADGVTIDPALRSNLQVVFQDPYASLNPRRRIRDTLAEPFRIGTDLPEAAIAARVTDLVRSVELPESVLERFPAQLSGGQRQRVAIARAIALKPALVIADEPVSALDITTQANIIALLRSLRHRINTSFLFISHDLGVVADLCDRVIVLEKGRIVESGATDRVFADPQHPNTRSLIEAIPGKARSAPPPVTEPPTPAAEPVAASAQRSNATLALRALRREPSALIGAALVGLVVLGALLAPLVAWALGHSPTEQFFDTALNDMGLPIGPTAAFPLGADGNGRDVLVRTLYGAQISLLVSIPATTLALLIGTTIGLIAGFAGGWVDKAISQGVDVAMSFPFVVTALSLLALNRGDQGQPVIAPVVVVILIISLFSWTYFARLARGLVIGLRHSPLVEAAQTIGASRAHIIFREILPNILPAVLVYWAVQLPTNIVAEATLSFLGVGIQVPVPSWGNMIAEAQKSSLYQVQPWFLIGPAVALFLTVAGFNTFSAGLRNVLDPHRNRD